MTANKFSVLYLRDEIQKFLCSSHRERGDYKIASSVKSFLYNSGKLRGMVGLRLFVQTVAISRFYDDNIRFCRLLRVADKRFINVSYIPREQNCLGFSVLGNRQFYRR